MRILLISDIHDHVSRVVRVMQRENFDVVFVAGDFTYFKSLDFVLKMFRKMRNVTNAPIYFVPGNCDPPDLMYFTDEEKKIFSIHEKIVSIDNLMLIGFGGSPITPFNTLIEFPEHVIKTKIENLLSKVDPRKTILLTHTPPYNALDRIYNGAHVGSTGLREIIEKFQPLAVFCGHIHEERGITNIGNTIIVHPGPLKHKYYAIVEIESYRIKPILKSL